MWSEKEIEMMIPRAGEFVGKVRFTFADDSITEYSYFEYEGDYFCCIVEYMDLEYPIRESYKQVSWGEIPSQFL